MLVLSNAFCSALNFGSPSRRAPLLPIEPCGLYREHGDLARKALIFPVQSLALRVNRRTLPASQRARMR